MGRITGRVTGRMREHKRENKRENGMQPRFQKTNRYVLPPDTKIEYKNISLLQRYITERGKIVSQRVSGVSGKQQREFSRAIKQARYLGLVSSGAAGRR